MPAQPLDVLAVGAHPDDVELSCGGTLCVLGDLGYRTGVVDLTRGELGTRGTPEQRLEEAEASRRILALDARENLGLPDGGLTNTHEHQRALIRAIRTYRPYLLLINAPDDRHPDHGDAARLTLSSQFYAGLRKIETFAADGTPQEPWRPSHVLHYMQSVEFEPTFVVDVSDVWSRRMEAVRAFASQFHTPERSDETEEPETFISTPGFMDFLEARARALGYRIGARYGEGLLYHHGPIGVDDLMQVLGRARPT